MSRAPLREWVEQTAAPIAYGILGLTPREFGRLTPAEFRAMARAAHAWHEEQEDFVARMVVPLMSITGLGKTRQRFTQEDLLGRPTQARRRASAEWKRRTSLSAAAQEAT